MIVTVLFTVATQRSQTDEWIKQNVVYTYNGVLFSLKKVGNSNTSYDR